ncbi:hypothetical protein [Cohaesibacter sp. CAU 1516]|uniref:hypothetical protein n=1 Tax=Cohaesibacter sp. CAU 1516 TaxID=2576038 RepID=UPI001AEF2C4F|nr:hypothetical protein [Cohaesibacter sp. CAU 1516]
MNALGEGHIPRLIGVVACIDLVGEYVLDALRVDVSEFVATKNVVRLKKAFYAGLGLKAA